MKKVWQKWKDTQLTLRQHIKSTRRTARQRHSGHALIQHQQLVLDTGRNRKKKPVAKLELKQKQTQKEQRWWNYRTRVSNHLLLYAQGFKEQHKHNEDRNRRNEKQSSGTFGARNTSFERNIHLMVYTADFTSLALRIPCSAMKEWPVPTCFRAGGMTWA